MSISNITYTNEHCGALGVIDLPGSKSMAARALIIDYIRGGDGDMQNMPDCDDTRELTAALKQLREAENMNFNLGTGGTSMRFFTALAASIAGLDAYVDCSDALRRRPLVLLTEALKRAGADIEYLEREGYAPLRIRGRKLPGGDLTIDGTVSSQYISALLMASLLWESPMNLKVEGEISRPYVVMTEKMIEREGRVVIESDWSAASYIYEAALLMPGCEIEVRSLTPSEDSVQGDSACAHLYAQLGVETRWNEDGSATLCCNPAKLAQLIDSGVVVEFDLGDVPDLTPSLAVGMALAGIHFRFTNVAHLRHKECDRMSALQNELGKLGYVVEADGESMQWNGEMQKEMPAEPIESYDDHRIAMSFALVALKRGAVAIHNADCVSKSFPAYFKEMAKIGIERTSEN